MFKLENTVRQNILKLQAYSSARDEFSGEAKVFLDANENPYGVLNRYPDPYQSKLKKKIRQIKKIDQDRIFIGNGSDEILDLAFRIFCEPKEDKALVFHPSYGMYKISAAINNVELLEIELNSDFQIDEHIISKIESIESLKLIIVCSPNNPTGNCLDILLIERLVKSFNGIVLIDEAYVDFSSKPSWISKTKIYPNLLVVQTLSKAWGMAAARIGMAFANEDIIRLFNKVKAPYNISTPNQGKALKALEDETTYKQNIQHILEEKQRMIWELKALTFVKKIYTSDANFILVKVTDANYLYKKLLSQGIVVRNRHSLADNCLRITIGKPEENDLLIKKLKDEESIVSG